MPKISQFDKRHESTHPRISTNSKQFTVKETNIETHYSQIVKTRRQRDHLESSEREVTHHRQGTHSKVSSSVLIRNRISQNMTYLKC